MTKENLPVIVSRLLPRTKSIQMLEKRKEFVTCGVSNATETFVDKAFKNSI